MAIGRFSASDFNVASIIAVTTSPSRPVTSGRTPSAMQSTKYLIDSYWKPQAFPYRVTASDENGVWNRSPKTQRLGSFRSSSPPFSPYSESRLSTTFVYVLGTIHDVSNVQNARPSHSPIAGRAAQHAMPCGYRPPPGRPPRHAMPFDASTPR